MNAKQYHRILKRRAARAKLEEMNRMAKIRKVFFCCDQLLPVQLNFIIERGFNVLLKVYLVAKMVHLIHAIALLARVATQACDAKTPRPRRAILDLA